MTAEEFVRAVRIQTCEAAVNGAIASFEQTSGRKPAEKDVGLSNWYNQLSGTDQLMLERALREAAELAVFRFFCVLDGVCASGADSDGEFQLYYSTKSERNRLNEQSQQELHNIFNKTCREKLEASKQIQIEPYECGLAQELRQKLQVGDGIDIHHAPDKYLSIQRIEQYDPQVAPVIALPTHEHRKLQNL